MPISVSRSFDLQHCLVQTPLLKKKQVGNAKQQVQNQKNGSKRISIGHTGLQVGCILILPASHVVPRGLKLALLFLLSLGLNLPPQFTGNGLHLQPFHPHTLAFLAFDSPMKAVEFN